MFALHVMVFEVLIVVDSIRSVFVGLKLNLSALLGSCTAGLANCETGLCCKPFFCR